MSSWLLSNFELCFMPLYCFRVYLSVFSRESSRCNFTSDLCFYCWLFLISSFILDRRPFGNCASLLMKPSKTVCFGCTAGVPWLVKASLLAGRPGHRCIWIDLSSSISTDGSPLMIPCFYSSTALLLACAFTMTSLEFFCFCRYVIGTLYDACSLSFSFVPLCFCWRGI